jgi:hypothetical protein
VEWRWRDEEGLGEGGEEMNKLLIIDMNSINMGSLGFDTVTDSGKGPRSQELGPLAMSQLYPP